MSDFSRFERERDEALERLDKTTMRAVAVETERNALRAENATLRRERDEAVRRAEKAEAELDGAKRLPKDIESRHTFEYLISAMPITSTVPTSLDPEGPEEPARDVLLHHDAALRASLAAREVEVERLRTQLPDGMKHCTIVFRECDKGHGWLTATNWIDHPCPTCRSEKAEAECRLQDVGGGAP